MKRSWVSKQTRERVSRWRHRVQCLEAQLEYCKGYLAKLEDLAEQEELDGRNTRKSGE